MSTNDPELAEAPASLWALFFGPTVWALHFLASYVSAAIWCAEVPQGEGFGALRLLVAAYTAVALLLIGIGAARGWKHHRYGDPAGPPHDADSPEDRHRFLGFASLLLNGLSAIATLYVAMTMLFFDACR